MQPCLNAPLRAEVSYLKHLSPTYSLYQNSFLLVSAPLNWVLLYLHCLLKAKFLKFYFLWGQHTGHTNTNEHGAAILEQELLSQHPSPQHKALDASPQASTHADKCMLCFPEPEVFTRTVNHGSKSFYMCHYTAHKNLHATEMKLDQRRSKQHHKKGR